MKWSRVVPGGYRSTCGRYEIEKLDNIVRGARAMWEIKGAGPVVTRKTLRVAKRYCEIHAACAKRRDTRTEAARKGGSVGAIKVRLPKATLLKLAWLAATRGEARVTVLCDLIDEAARVTCR